MNNPAFSNAAFSQNGQNAAQAARTGSLLAGQANQDALEQQWSQHPTDVLPDDDVMTVHDTIVKSFGAFAVLLVAAGVGWVFGAALPWLWVAGMIVGLVLGLVNSFKREPVPGLILAYAAAEGLFLGGISMFLEASMPGIVSQAVIATLCVVGVTLALFASGRIRASAKVTKVFMIALIGYGVFSLVNIVLQLTGVSTDPWGLRTGVEIMGIPLGLILGVLAVVMGAYSLVLDFDFIQRGVQNRAPRRYGWTGAFGILMTVIWLYVEILRLIAILRR